MTPEQWQARQRAIATATTAQLMSLWSQVDRRAIGPSWDPLVEQAVGIVSAAQLAAAREAGTYVNDAIAAQVATAGAGPAPVAAAFAGAASDGRPLETLLALPSSQAGRAVAAGSGVDAAMSYGRTKLVDLAATQVYDAGRVATGVGIAAHPQAGGYRRQLRGASNCSRCVLLAGKWYRWNQGFRRHPRCDCAHVPSVGRKSDYAGMAGFDPHTYFESLTAEQQDRIFTKAGAQAVRDGADLNQVVNSRRGMRTTTQYGRKVKSTTVGTSTRAQAGQRLRDAGASTFQAGTANRVRRVNVPRLTPEQIYADASDREDAVRLLRRFGYIN